MANFPRPQRRINSPGVQIDEVDLSQYLQPQPGTTVFVAGYAPQGPADEIINITSSSEFEQIYGLPQTPAERYFYHSCKEVLNSPGNLLTTRLPYGSGGGEIFGGAYGALFYPVLSAGTTVSTGVSGTGSLSGVEISATNITSYQIGAPVHITLNDTEYDNIIQGNVSWSPLSSTFLTPGKIGTPSNSTPINISNTGIIVLNSSKTTVNEAFEGYYVTLADNTNFGPETAYDSVTKLYSLSGYNSFAELPSTRYSFALSAASGTSLDSISEVIEKVPTYNFGDTFYRDSLILNVFKLRNSIYEPENLVYSLAESHIGSFDPSKQSIADGGGTPKTFFLENIVNRSSNNIKLLINPILTDRANWTSLSSTTPARSVTVAAAGKSVNAVGTYLPAYANQSGKDLGNIPTKLSRALSLVELPETINIDVVVDAGLSTIHANSITVSDGSKYYDDKAFQNTSTISTNIASWRTITDTFNIFTSQTRKDCIFISDPLRQIFVNGEDTKTLSLKTNTFTTNVYTNLKNSYTGVNTNYTAAYANWVKTYDQVSDKRVWVPASGFVGAVYARSDSQSQQWFAPAGLNRGIINNALDLAINPNQKQRDNLYTIALNPIVYFPGDGYVVFGQKTLQTKPTAFDRVNVRRLFLALEKATLKSLKYFVFEPNTEFTRSRLKATLTPIFELAKNTEGVYDYLIVCDERNNTADSIDRSELLVDIYIKPVKAAEFILVNFIATRTGQNFEELI
jgi:hypothetical protein